MKNLILFILFICSTCFLLKDEFTSKVNKIDIKIVGLNLFGQSDLELTKKTIKDVFDLDCEIQRLSIISGNSNKLICENVQSELGNSTNFEFDKNQEIEIFVTSSDLYSNNLNVRGICYGNQIYIQNDKIKVNVIHELSHSFGLEHCENECIMNSYAINRWNDINDKPIFCNDCKSKLP
jgi:hypothetical protein